MIKIPGDFFEISDLVFAADFDVTSLNYVRRLLNIQSHVLTYPELYIFEAEFVVSINSWVTRSEIKKSPGISKYHKFTAFLKRKIKGYPPKTS